MVSNMIRDTCSDELENEFLCRTYGARHHSSTFSQPLQAGLTSPRTYGAGIAVHRLFRRPWVSLLPGSSCRAIFTRP